MSQAHIGPPKVECWFCGKSVFKKRTTRLPNGARVCRSHFCDLCGDYIRPGESVTLDYGANAEGERKTDHICRNHRRAILECLHRGGKLVQREDKQHGECQMENE